MTARMAMASGPAMSSRAASAAQASRKEAATTAVPNASRAKAAGGCTPARRRTRAGTVSATHPAIGWPTGRASFGDMTTLRTDAPPGPRGHPGQATLLAEGLAHPGSGPATGGPRSPQYVDDRLPDYSPSDAEILAVILLIAQLTISLWDRSPMAQPAGAKQTET